MADKHTLRQYLTFREIIARTPDPTFHVDVLLAQNPDWDPEETKTWEAWKADDLPRPAPSRRIETAEVTSGVL